METWLVLLLSYLMIFAARVTDMSLDVMRVLLLTRGKKGWASIVGFVEVTIFIIVLNEVLQGGLNDPGKVIAYAAGFGMGNYVGSLIEEKLAVGFLALQIFPHYEVCESLKNLLRKERFGVTELTGQGRSGPRSILYVLLKRKDLNRALRLLDEYDPDVFYHVSDARSIHGGIFPGKRIGK
ncbi:MAG: DUF2179 domain-containing protein [Peptococcaceae bacterium]|nr:DUF2179 domain-containing protein [Peptococcaceae bacterium]